MPGDTPDKQIWNTIVSHDCVMNERVYIMIFFSGIGFQVGQLKLIQQNVLKLTPPELIVI